MATAGDLLRDALEQGASQLGLAKQLAGTTNDRDAEVIRWRYVVRRAAAGGEPQESNVSRIAETFDVSAGDLDRPRRATLRSRAELEEEVADLTVALDASRRAHERLQRRVLALEKAVFPQAQRATRRGRNGP